MAKTSACPIQPSGFWRPLPGGWLRRLRSLTPCDFSFPATGVKGKTAPNTGMLLVADVDLAVLDRLRRQGSVQNLRSRRYDVYSLSSAELMPRH